MPTDELRVLLHNYKTAYTAYMSCVQALTEATLKQEWPAAELLGKEERSLQDVNYNRQALLDALYAHTHPSKKGKAGGSKEPK